MLCARLLLSSIAILAVSITTPRAEDGASIADLQSALQAAAPEFAGTTFAGVMASGSSTYALRVSNRGPRAGTATVTLVSAATGTVLGTWTSASIPVYGAIQSDVSTIAAAATPALSAAAIAAPVNLAITTTFAPAIQLVTTNSQTGVLTNVTACGSRLFEDIDFLSYVEGPACSGVTSAVRIVNTSGTQTSRADLTLYDAGTGTELGTWTSPSIPPGASVTTSTATIGAAASPAVPITNVALTILAKATLGLRLEHAVTGGGSVADATDACGF